MPKDTKILVGILLGTFIMLAGLVFISSRNSSGQEPSAATEVLGVEASPDSYDLGNVPINGGKVEREYQVKNDTGKTIKLKKLATSCMCTTAKVKLGDKESNFFGMEGMGDSNPPLNWDVATGETMTVTAVFDPAAHGPAGLGPIDRSIYLTFSDPGGVKELKFDGVVISQ